MNNEYRLNYTAAEINNLLAKIKSFPTEEDIFTLFVDNGAIIPLSENGKILYKSNNNEVYIL